MAEQDKDRPIAPRRTLGGPVLPPPPPEIAERERQAKLDAAEREKAAAKAEAENARRQAERTERQRERVAAKESAQQERRDQARAREEARAEKAAERARQKEELRARKDAEKNAQKRSRQQDDNARPRSLDAGEPQRRPPGPAPTSRPPREDASGEQASPPVRRSTRARVRRAQLRLVQVDAWSVMKTSFLLSIALGIVLVVAVAIIMSVLGAAGVWDSVNSIVQQAVGSDSGDQFQIQQYVGFQRVLGITLIIAVADVLLITAIATLGAFLYNLSAALLGGIEVTLAEDD